MAVEVPEASQVNEAVDSILESRDTTCLIVAHRLSTIARAERIVVLEGKLRVICQFRDLILVQMVVSPNLELTDSW